MLKRKKAGLVAVSVLLMLLTASCGKSGDGNTSTAYTDMVLGEDFTDLNVKLNFVTYRTDLIADDPDIQDFQDYKREFNELYPNIDIIVEGIPDYDVDMTSRLSSGDWDICSVPTPVKNEDLSKYFEPLGQYDVLSEKYEFVNLKMQDNVVYGIPSSFNAQGIVYNKRVFEEAGISKVPTTPDEFLDALQKIKDNTDAIPLYTNYGAGWTLTAWDFYDLTSVGNIDYRYQVFPFEENPFSQKEDHTGLYEVYRILYESAARGLIEDDPANTNWEMCKTDINNGAIGCMVLGSWAVPQMQGGGDHPEDIGYMPFPISVNGKQYAIAGGDYCFGVNARSSDEKKTAAKLWIKYLIEKSAYATDQGGISIVKGSDYPDVFGDFEGVELMLEPSAEEGKENYYALVNEASLNLGSDAEHIMRLIDSGIDQSETFDEIMEDWNAQWTEAQKQNIPET